MLKLKNVLIVCLLCLLVSCSIDSLSINTNKNSASYSKESGTTISHGGNTASGTINVKRNSSAVQ